MERILLVMLLIFNASCSFDSSGLDDKTLCYSNSDCLNNYTCLNQFCIRSSSIPISETETDASINDSATDEEVKDSGIDNKPDESFEPVCSLEICDGLDNDCDGKTDEDFNIGQPCSEGKGICRSTGRRICYNSYAVCNAEAFDYRISDEICDGLDNDCDGETDEGLLECCQWGQQLPCGASDVGECETDIQICTQERVWSYCAAIEPAEEICDNLDNNCDGQTDENNPCPENQLCLDGSCVEHDCTLYSFEEHTYIKCGSENWYGARDYCRSLDSYLVTVNSDTENTFLLGIINDCTWMGLNDQAQEGIWSWENGEQVNYYNWAHGEPNNAQSVDLNGENCVEWNNVLNFGWNDIFCARSQSFICEWNRTF